MEKRNNKFKEPPPYAEMDIAEVVDARTGEITGYEVTLLVTLQQADDFFEYVRRLRTG